MDQRGLNPTRTATEQDCKMLLRQDNQDHVLIGTVSHSDGRGIQDLLSAFALLRERHNAIRLIVVGDGLARASWEKCANDLKIVENVVFAGAQQDIAAWIGAFDIFALPFPGDSVPPALLEAMAAGKAVVTTATARLRKIIIDGKTGRLVPPGDVEGFARALAVLIENKDERHSIGSQAQQYAEEMYGGSLFAGRASYGYATDAPVSSVHRTVKRLITSSLPKRWLIWRGRPDRRQFALTFDDGPDPVFTPRILEILRAHKVCATFFLVGNRAEEHPDIVQRIADEGHEIGNHSYTHPRFKRLTYSAAVQEVSETARILEGLHHRGRLFRPPFGLSSQSLVAAWRTQLQIAMFSVDLKDYRASHPSEISARLDERGIINGDIILYHGTNENSLLALPKVIERARHGGRKDLLVSNLEI